MIRLTTADVTAPRNEGTRRRRAIADALRRHPASRAVDAGPTARQLVDAEIARSRRHERPFSVIAVALGMSSESTIVRGCLRETDQIAVEPGRVIAVLPETDAAGVDPCVERIVSQTSVAADGISVVTFPTVALTSGRIFELLDGSSPRRSKNRDGASGRLTA